MCADIAKKKAEQVCDANAMTTKQRAQKNQAVHPTKVARLLVLFFVVLWCADVQAILQPVARINAGGNALVDSQGNAWEADSLHAYYKWGGTMGEHSNTSTNSISNTTDPTLYQSERWWRRSKQGPYLYQIPVPQGVYTVELHFAEINSSRSKEGSRVFDIWVEGALFYPNFDIVVTAGAVFAAVNVSTTVTVVDGALTIELRVVRFNPKISAIAVYQNVEEQSALPTIRAPEQPAIEVSKQPIIIVQPITISYEKTTDPSEQPTTRVSKPQTIAPSGKLAAVPQEQPTIVATERPSTIAQPTAIPYDQTTTIPWGQSTTILSELQTIVPSGQLAAVPSEQLTIIATEWPSTIEQPTPIPDEQTNTVPSEQPATVTSGHQTIVPSGQLAAIPPEQPTTTVTEKPFTLEHPTAIPYDQTTTIPSGQSTTVVSELQTIAPSGQLAAIPSERPTTVATERPSTIKQPTPISDEQTTTVPSEQPATVASEHQTIVPSGQLAAVPSPHPTIAESKQPTTAVTEQLSTINQPAPVPDEQETTVPSEHPTTVVSKHQTIAPSGQLAAVPSERPSTVGPTTIPYDQTTKVPSEQPTTVVSEYQTIVPSGQLAAVSSPQSTIAVSEKPTIAVTERPTAVPSEQPAAVPLEQPATFLSEQPTTAAKAQPGTAAPRKSTIATSGIPTRVPLKQAMAILSGQPAIMTTEKPSKSPSDLPFQPVLINAGGGSYVDVEGHQWIADVDFTGGQTASFALSISGTQDDQLYQSERYGIFTYEIPLPPGNYEVILHFAELVNITQGDRIFNISVEQSLSFLDVDIVALVGVATALTMETVATIIDGSLSLSFLAVIGIPKLSAIEINLVSYHLAHAVASGPYTTVDVLGRGFASVTVDGTSSHTHAPGLYLTSWTWFEGSTVIGIGEIATLNLSVGQHVVTLLVKDNGDNESSDTTTVTVLPIGYPVITSLSPSSGNITGGNSVTISGYGFNFTADTTVVHFGSYNLTGVSQIAIRNVNTIVVQSIPAATIGIPVLVTVSTPIGESNTGTYTYVNMVPIDWTDGNLYNIYAPTTLAFGPDEKLYIGTSDGKLAKLTLSENYAVIESVVSTIVGQRAILGLTFDPMDRSANPPLYVAHSKTFHGEYRSSSGQAINGKVSLVSGANLDVILDIITGLPVSDHDHAVNGLEFGDAGELYIMIGGNTNGGIPGALSGSERQKDNVLSSAALVAYLSDPHFNGFLTYDAPDDGNLNPDFGVEVFAAGLRNPYDVVLHSNKKLYATDNGPNLNYGAMSTSCTRSIPDIGEKDKLNLLVRGGYYGQPNRKRGETDPRQCVWHSVLEASNGNYTAPLATLQSSSDGIIEFQSDHFGSQMRGNLIVSMYTGGLYRVILNPDGTAVADTPFIFQSDGGLDVEQGPDGTLFVAKYKTGKIRYLIPLEPASTMIVVKSVFPRRGGQAGGNVISIFGENLSIGGSPTVSVGGSACPVLTYTATKITCTLPGGSVTVDITVTTGSETSTFLAGYRYITGLPASTSSSP